MNASAIVYVEIPSPDIEKARVFYSSIFNWKIESSQLNAEGYLMFSSGEKSLIGGLDPSKAVCEGGVIIYIKVDDIASTLTSIKNQGGEVLREKFDIGGGYGFSAIFSDSNGNHMGLWSNG